MLHCNRFQCWTSTQEINIELWNLMLCNMWAILQSWFYLISWLFHKLQLYYCMQLVMWKGSHCQAESVVILGHKRASTSVSPHGHVCYRLRALSDSAHNTIKDVQLFIRLWVALRYIGTNEYLQSYLSSKITKYWFWVWGLFICGAKESSYFPIHLSVERSQEIISILINH